MALPSFSETTIRNFLLKELEKRGIKAATEIQYQTPIGLMKPDALLQNGADYIIETKLWAGEKRYQEGKKQLARYLESEQVDEGHYLVFDYRKRDAEERKERENINQKTILSYCIPVL